VNPTLSFPPKIVFSFASQKTSLLFEGFCKRVVLSCIVKTDNTEKTKQIILLYAWVWASAGVNNKTTSCNF